MITDRLRETYPRQAGKIDTLWTWVNTNIFRPQPFPVLDGPFRIIFVGRLDEFKVPRLMFKTIARLRQALGEGGVEFHYIGTSDPHHPLVEPVVPADHVEEGGLARAVGPDEGGHRSFGDLEAAAIQGPDPAE